MLLNGALATFYECETECIEIEDTLGWVTPVPADPSLDGLLSSQIHESTLLACGMSVSRDRWEFNGITGIQVKYCNALDYQQTETFETLDFSKEQAEEVNCG